MEFSGKSLGRNEKKAYICSKFIRKYDMARGDAWKTRQWDGRISDERRNYTERILKSEPQFQFDNLYIPPFRQRRCFTKEGYEYYELMDWPRDRTGIHVFDDYLIFLAEGHPSLEPFLERHGLKWEDVEGLTFALTGLRGTEFRTRWHVRQADELLRYTQLELGDVARRAGFGTAGNLYLTYKREFGIAPGKRRRMIREKNDVGRFLL